MQNAGTLPVETVLYLKRSNKKITTYSGGTVTKHSQISDKRHYRCKNLFCTTCKLERKLWSQTRPTENVMRLTDNPAVRSEIVLCRYAMSVPVVISSWLFHDSASIVKITLKFNMAGARILTVKTEVEWIGQSESLKHVNALKSFSQSKFCQYKNSIRESKNWNVIWVKNIIRVKVRKIIRVYRTKKN